MGGLIGIWSRARAGSPIRGLVLNDVGPLIPWPALAGSSSAPEATARGFAGVDEVEKYCREACAPSAP